MKNILGLTSLLKYKMRLRSLPFTAAIAAVLCFAVSQTVNAAPPVNINPPTISTSDPNGNVGMGDTLTVDPGTWSNRPTFTYQWETADASDIDAIAGATASTYHVRQNNLGEIIDVSVTASNASGSATAMAGNGGLGPVSETVAQVDSNHHWDPHAWTTDAGQITKIHDGMELDALLDSVPGTFPIPPNSQPADNSPLGKFNAALIVFNNFKHTYDAGTELNSVGPGMAVVINNLMTSGQINKSDLAQLNPQIAASGNPTLKEGLKVITANMPQYGFFDVGAMVNLAFTLNLEQGPFPEPPFPDSDVFYGPNTYISNWVPAITSALTASGDVGTSFSYTIRATNSPAVPGSSATFNATGLPPGLSVNTHSGVISGKPTTAGTFRVRLSAKNAAGTDNRTLTLTVSP